MLDTIVGVIGTTVVGIVGWAIQLNSKVAVNAQKNDDLKELITEKFKGLDERNDQRDDDLNRRLERIERAMNGALKHV